MHDRSKGTYINVFRKMLSWGWYTDTVTKAVFLHILLKANYRPSEYKGHTIPRGACVFGRKSWAKELNLTEQQVRTAINHLKSTNEITTKSTNKFTIITVVKWDYWQGCEDKATTKPTTKPPNEQPTTNQQLTTSKESKKDIKKDYFYYRQPKSNDNQDSGIWALSEEQLKVLRGEA